MGRALRLQYQGALYHITSRGNENCKIFITKANREKFLEYLKTGIKKYRIKVYAYCLMDNHYHLLLEITKPNLSKFMHYLNTSYTIYFNIERKRKGHLFQGRYKSILVDKDKYLLELIRYIHLNPARAKITKNIEEYPYTSYKEYLKEDESFINREEILLQFSEEITRAKEVFKEFIQEGINKSMENPNKKVVYSFILGDEEFINKIKKMIRKKEVASDIISRKELITDIKQNDIINAVAEYYKISTEEVKEYKEARKIAIYLIKEETDLSLNEIGEIFNISYSGITHTAKRLKEAIRKDKDIRKRLNEITEILSKIKS